MVTINKRETSYEGLVSKLENGEDGLYNLIHEDKQTILQPKISITQQDLEDIPYLRQLRAEISRWEQALKKASGRNAYRIKKALIEMRKDQYLIKQSFKPPITPNKLTFQHSYIPLDDTTPSPDSEPQGISFLNPTICAAFLQYYSKLKQDSSENFISDTWYLIYDFERLIDKALVPYPIYLTIVECKIDGLSLLDIQQKIQIEYGIKHSPEYISSLWRKKIPKLIAATAEEQFLDYYYLNCARGQYKKCSRCGQIKLAHNKYFSKNNTSKDGFYSLCKECRNKKKVKNNE